MGNGEQMIDLSLNALFLPVSLQSNLEGVPGQCGYMVLNNDGTIAEVR